MAERASSVAMPPAPLSSSRSMRTLPWAAAAWIGVVPSVACTEMRSTSGTQ
jgi:hypothetical protein